MGSFNLGAFLGGAGVGYKFVRDAEAQEEDTKWKRTERERAQKKYAKDDTIDAATSKAMDDAGAEADRLNSVSTVSNPHVDIGALQGRPAPDQQPSMAANPEAPGYGPNPSSMAGKIGVSPPMDSGITAEPVSRPPVTKEDIYWNKFAKDVEAVHLKNNDIAGAEAIRKLGESRSLQQYAKKWMAAKTAIDAGDYEGSLPQLEDLYNQNYKDGKFVKITKGEGGAFTVTQYDADGKQLGVKSATAKELSGNAAQALEPGKYIELEVKQAAEERAAARTEKRDDKKYAQQMSLQTMKETAQAMRDDKRFATMLEVADKRAKRGELGGKQPTHVATAEWLKERGIAKTDAEAWKMATQLGEAVNEKVTTDQYGNTTTADPQTGEIARYGSNGEKTVVRPATKAKGGVTTTLPAAGKVREYVPGKGFVNK